jgi:hypothetical protein
MLEALHLQGPAWCHRQRIRGRRRRGLRRLHRPRPRRPRRQAPRQPIRARRPLESLGQGEVRRLAPRPRPAPPREALEGTPP